MKRKSILETIVALLVFLFLYTGLTKYLDSHIFQFSLSQAPVIKNFYLPIAYIMPGIELLVAAALIFPRTRLLGLYSSAFLMTIFTIYLTLMVLFASKLPCGCGGVIGKLTWKQHIFFNLFFVIASFVGIRLQKNSALLTTKNPSKIQLSKI